MNTSLYKNLFLRPFQTFFNKEARSGVLLILCTVIALIWANSPFAGYYAQILKTYVMVGVGEASINKPLILWINDGLMAIFFFVVGLEIKRELLSGELSSPRKAALPFAAAVGGAAIPALIFVAFNAGTPNFQGWGVPMATDIAFALGVLALMGKRAPLALKIFVTALAIVDDLIAVLVIAVFYTAEISMVSIGIGLVLLTASAIANRTGIHSTLFYSLIGVAIWVAFLKSGVHATVAGVLLAMTIPVETRLNLPDFMQKSRALLKKIDSPKSLNEMPTSDQRYAIHSLEVVSKHVLSPLQRMEHGLHSWVAYVIMPIFALANAGVSFSPEVMDGLLANSVFWGIFLGLLIGKPVGVFATAWLAIRINLAELPKGVSWGQLFGAGALAGIGFTMALFIANLAFDNLATLETAKLAILAASLVSGIAGWAILSRGNPVAAEYDMDEEEMELMFQE